MISIFLRDDKQKFPLVKEGILNQPTNDLRLNHYGVNVKMFFYSEVFFLIYLKASPSKLLYLFRLVLISHKVQPLYLAD